MNILFLSLGVFEELSEKSIYTDLLREFVNNNHNVYIMTPREKRMKETSQKYKNGGATFIKVRIGNIKNVNLIEKGISTVAIEFQFMHAIKKYLRDVKFDLVLYATPPITFYNVIKYIKNRDGARTYLMLKDIFPQNSVDLGMFNKKSLIYKYFRRKEKNLYSISDEIGCMSPANKTYLISNNDYLKSYNIEILPNTITPIDIKLTRDEKTEIRNKYDIPLDKKVFVYGGNLGKPQGIDFLIECIQNNELNKESFFLIVGDGTEFNKLKNVFEKKEISNSKLLSKLPKEDYEVLVNSCDVGMIFLDYRFTIPNFPSRILSYMQASMPILAATDNSTDIGRIIEEGDFGIGCSSSDINSFNKAVQKLSDANLIFKMGKASREYLLNNYTSAIGYKIIIKHFKNKETNNNE